MRSLLIQSLLGYTHTRGKKKRVRDGSQALRPTDTTELHLLQGKLKAVGLHFRDYMWASLSESASWTMPKLCRERSNRLTGDTTVSRSSGQGPGPVQVPEIHT